MSCTNFFMQSKTRLNWGGYCKVRKGCFWDSREQMPRYSLCIVPGPDFASPQGPRSTVGEQMLCQRSTSEEEKQATGNLPCPEVSHGRKHGSCCFWPRWIIEKVKKQGQHIGFGKKFSSIALNPALPPKQPTIFSRCQFPRIFFSNYNLLTPFKVKVSSQNLTVPITFEITECVTSLPLKESRLLVYITIQGTYNVPFLWDLFPSKCAQGLCCKLHNSPLKQVKQAA